MRPATLDDVGAALELDVAAFGADAWSEASMREELLGGGRVSVVAGEPVAGFAVARSAGDVVDLQRIVVHPERRRRGLAHLLLAEVCPGPLPVLLEVSETNASAIAFYGSEGFTEIARRARYYRDGSDAVVMRREGRPG